VVHLEVRLVGGLTDTYTDYKFSTRTTTTTTQQQQHTTTHNNNKNNQQEQVLLPLPFLLWVVDFDGLSVSERRRTSIPH